MAWTALIPTVVNLVVDIVKEVKPQIDEDRWEALGPEIAGLVEKALSGEDISHEDLMKYIPEQLSLEILQLKKKKERVEAGLPI